MQVSKLVIHHSASPKSSTTRDRIAEWHKERGFTSVGYHQVIEASGIVKAGRSESTMGAHAKGANSGSLGVCVCGNFQTEMPGAGQIDSLVTVLTRWCKEHSLTAADIYGHYNVPGGATATACPGTNLKSRFATIKERVTTNLTGPKPRYVVEQKVTTPNVRRALHKALDDGRLTYDEVWSVIRGAYEDGNFSPAEIADFAAILSHSQTIDDRSRRLLEGFVKAGPSLPPVPVPGGGGGSSPGGGGGGTSSSGKLTKNFALSEFACHGTPVPANLRSNVQELADNLQVLRDDLAAPIGINSGYRTVEHNRTIGGKTNSQHLLAKAGDIRVSGYKPATVHKRIGELISAGSMKQGGLGLYNTFVHYDVRGERARWNKTT